MLESILHTITTIPTEGKKIMLNTLEYLIFIFNFNLSCICMSHLCHTSDLKQPKMKQSDTKLCAEEEENYLIILVIFSSMLYFYLCL